MAFRGSTNRRQIGGDLTTVISLGDDRAERKSPVTAGIKPDLQVPGARPATQPERPEFLTIRGLRIRYVAQGSGKPLLLLHGWGTSLDTFHAMAADLARVCRVVAFDFPGHGESDVPPGTWHVDDFMELTRGVMAELGIERAAVLGHSFGGRVAIKLAAAHPQAVERLVLVDAAGVPQPRTVRRALRRAASRFANAIGRNLGSPGQAIRRAIVRRIASPDYLNAGPLRATFVAIVNEDLRPSLPDIKCPTLLVWGETDDDTPLADARTMEKLIPGATLLILKNAGHFSYLDQYGRLRLALIPFLNG
jgi:pimeloyl-ACP methyl ester carboxylesterase